MVPLPPAYDACAVAAPIPSVSCGLPVTVTGIWKPISTPTSSPAPYVSPETGLVLNRAEATSGGVTVPSIWSLSNSMFSLSAASAPPALRIVPPFSVSAPRSTTNPFASRSVARTV